MKALLIAALLLAGMIPVTAQGIFNQNNTQRKYLMEQIAMLQTYLGYVKQGNNIIKNGTNLIGSSKQGELDLHKGYFSSLRTVNGKFRGNEKVTAILAMHDAMSGSRKATISKAMQSGQFSSGEIAQLKTAYANLAAEAEKDIDELMLVITDGQLEMTDDERIREIDRLYLLMQKKYALQRAMNNNILAIASGRTRDLDDIKTIRGLYGN
jgi:hypothetical protein